VVRNHLAEQQLTRADLLESVVEQFRDQPDLTGQEVMPGKLCFDDVIARSLGTFAGTSLPTSIPKPWVMQCCTGNATQGLYYAWEGALRETGDKAVVNLLLNRAGRLVDVDSYLPYEGKVAIRNKGARRLAVRIPSWVDRRTLRADVSGVPCEADWTGRYLNWRDLPADAVIALSFPVKETTATYTVNAGTPWEQPYTCVFRGSTLVDISPRDMSATSYPLYQRSAMRQSEAPRQQVQRFVPDGLVRNW
jgi:hypothetical protein